jgi:hypothetical protein
MTRIAKVQYEPINLPQHESLIVTKQLTFPVSGAAEQDIDRHQLKSFPKENCPEQTELIKSAMIDIQHHDILSACCPKDLPS